MDRAIRLLLLLTLFSPLPGCSRSSPVAATPTATMPAASQDALVLEIALNDMLSNPDSPLEWGNGDDRRLYFDLETTTGIDDQFLIPEEKETKEWAKLSSDQMRAAREAA